MVLESQTFPFLSLARLSALPSLDYNQKNHGILIKNSTFFFLNPTDDNKTLAPNYNIGWPFFDIMVRDHIMQYNYTLNPEGIYGAIKYMYTYYPDPNNKSHIREEFINVSIFCISLKVRFSQKAEKI